MASDSQTLTAGDHERRVLVLPATSTDGVAIGKLFAANDIACVTFSEMKQMCAALRRGAGAAIVAEEMLLAEPDTLPESLGKQPVWSNIPLIILSRSGRESAKLSTLLSELGDATVVERPIRTTTLVTLVRSSLRARDRQYQVREHLLEQERAQRTIREVEQRYRSLIENITDYAVFMTDADGRINSWNSGSEAIFGYTADDTRGKTIELLSTRDDIASGTMLRELLEARQVGRASSDGWKMRKDGTRLYIEGVTVARFDDAGLEGFAHFLRDVTESHRIAVEREILLDSERAARSEAERAGRVKDEFLATLSHELRTPLNAILGWTQVLKKTGALNANAASAVEVIERNARSQAQIIADLLDMSSIISGKVRLEVQRLDLSSVLNATVETLRPTAQAKGIQLQVELDREARLVRGDPHRLQQVFWNLLTNAVKFTPKDGWVSVTLARVDSHLTVEVADNGEGMEPAFLPQVFDRFRQADASSTRRHGGLGLGLSIVKQLVELHGGSIDAHSSGPGQGSTFRVTLPLMDALDDTFESTHRVQLTPSSELTAGDKPKVVNLAGVKVLVVDDEPDARALVERLLSDCEAQVKAAGSVAEALRILASEPTDVLVSDIGMPGEDGYSLIRRVRAMPNEIAKVPAIALTAYARAEDRMKAIDAGFQVHLPKPVEPVELISMVASLSRERPPRS